jgi:hypothetical protein
MEIEGFPNYLIYEDGRVWSKITNKYLKNCLNNDGYYRVGLFNNKKKKFYSIHRLLALHFIPNPDNKDFVDHIDRNKTNNSLENLRWATRSENNQNTGLRKDNKLGEKYIHFEKAINRFRFEINREHFGKITKRFHFLEDAIIYRDIFCFENDINLDLD